MAFLQDFYIQALKNKKAKTNDQLDFKNKPGVDYKGDIDFFGSFLSVTSPEAAQQINQLSTDTKKKITDNALKSGMSMENINNTLTGQPLSEVQQPSKSLLDRAGDLAKGFVSSYDRAGTSIGDSLAYGSKDATGARNAQQNLLDQNTDIIAKAGQQLRDPNVPEEKKVRIRKLIETLGGTNQEVAQQAAGEAQRVQEQLDPVKNVAAIANIGMDIATLGTVAGAATGAKVGMKTGQLYTGKALEQGAKTLGRQVATGAAQGATAGVFGAYEQNGKNTTLKDVATGAALGGVLGGGLTAGAGKFGQWLTEKRAVKAGAVPITDTTRLLPDGTQSKAARLIEIDNELEGFNKLNSTAETVLHLPKENSYVKLTEAEANVLTDEIKNIPFTKGDMPHLTAGERVLQSANEISRQDMSKLSPNAAKALENAQKGQQTISSDMTKSLMKERQQLVKEIDAIKNPVARVAEEINMVDGDLQKAMRIGDNKTAAKLQKEYDVLVDQGAQIEKQIEIEDLVSGKTKSAAAARTEADAIEKNLTDGYGEDVTGYLKETGFLKNQGIQTSQLMDQDYDLAKRVAMGEVEPPNGLQSSSVYEGVKTRAIKEGDTDLIRRLATESKVPTMGTQKGRFNAAFAYRDPENPVTALQDLVKARKASKLNIPATVTKEETERVTELAAEVARTKSLVELGKADRLEYGMAHVKYMKYVEGLKEAANKKTVKEMLSHPVDTAVSLAGVTKSLRATLDNSALFRQGLKTLTTHPGTWLKNASQSFVDIAKTLKGNEVMDFVNADIVSRQNALNGLYKRMGLDVAGGKGKVVEEAFPGIAQEKIPGIGRLFKASDVAYTAFLQRTRADLADKYLDYAVKAGVDITDKKQIESIGKLVNSLTSRGDLGRLEGSARVLNNVFFSPRLVKANMDILTAHQFQRGVTPFVRKRAALNLLKMAASVGAVLTVANEVRPGSVEWDPRSSDFGKIKVGNTRFDVAGGMAGFVTLGSRLATTSSKSSSTGEVTDLNTGDFGSKTSADVLLDFTQNKFSPAAGVVRDYLRGKNFSGEKPTVGSTLNDLFVPLVIDNYKETKKDPNSANTLVALIADGLGIGTNTYGVSNNWKANTSRELEGFKQKVGEKKFTEANDKFNQQYADWFTQIRQDDAFWKLPQEDRKNYLTLNKDRIKKEVLKNYGYEYTKTKRTNQTQSIINELDKYKK